MNNKEILLSLYDEAKKKRIVLNQDEFARLLDFSRAHLFKKMKIIPNEVIDKARSIINTDIVSNEHPNNLILHEPIGQYQTKTHVENELLRERIKDLEQKWIEGLLKIKSLFLQNKINEFPSDHYVFGINGTPAEKPPVKVADC